MNAFEFHRAIEKITPDVIREIGVQSVQENAAKTGNYDFDVTDNQTVFNDMFRNNNIGLTFAGNKIAGVGKFSDWVETGEFRKNLQFIDEKDIELVSWGDGFDAITGGYSETNWIAPSAKILEKETMQKIKQSFIKILKEKTK